MSRGASTRASSNATLRRWVARAIASQTLHPPPGRTRAITPLASANADRNGGATARLEAADEAPTGRDHRPLSCQCKPSEGNTDERALLADRTWRLSIVASCCDGAAYANAVRSGRHSERSHGRVLYPAR